MSVYVHRPGPSRRLLQGLHTGLEPSHLILRSRQLSHANGTLLRFVGGTGAKFEADITTFGDCGSFITLQDGGLPEGRSNTKKKPGNHEREHSAFSRDVPGRLSDSGFSA